MDKSRNLIIILIIIILILIVALVGSMIYIFNNQEKGTNKNENKLENESQNVEYINSIDETENEIADSLKEMEKNSFNVIFEAYEGQNCSKSQVKALISAVETNNSAEDMKHKITLNNSEIVSSEQENNDSRYNIEISYDEDGFVNEITITEASENEVSGENAGNTAGDMEKLIFNTNLNSYVGDITGKRLNTLLQTIEESNTRYPEHQVTISSNNLQSLNQIVETEVYTITASYDDDGYINNINMDKK